jgi:hypothetical protein
MSIEKQLGNKTSTGKRALVGVVAGTVAAFGVLAGCSTDNTGGGETPAPALTVAGAPKISGSAELPSAAPTDENLGEDIGVDNKTDESETSESEQVGLPEDWESWGVSAEVANARWTWLQKEAQDEATKQGSGWVVFNFGIKEDSPNKYHYTICPEGKPKDGSYRQGEFPTGRKPSLWD